MESRTPSMLDKCPSCGTEPHPQPLSLVFDWIRGTVSWPCWHIKLTRVPSSEKDCGASWWQPGLGASLPRAFLLCHLQWLLWEAQLSFLPRNLLEYANSEKQIFFLELQLLTGHMSCEPRAAPAPWTDHHGHGPHYLLTRCLSSILIMDCWLLEVISNFSACQPGMSSFWGLLLSLLLWGTWEEQFNNGDSYVVFLDSVLLLMLFFGVSLSMVTEIKPGSCTFFCMCFTTESHLQPDPQF